MTDTKSLWASKTFWTQIVGVAAMLATLLGLDLGPETQTNIVSGILAVQAVLSAIFRSIARQKIA